MRVEDPMSCNLGTTWSPSPVAHAAGSGAGAVTHTCSTPSAA